MCRAGIYQELHCQLPDVSKALEKVVIDYLAFVFRVSNETVNRAPHPFRRLVHRASDQVTFHGRRKLGENHKLSENTW
jgi:hypothetical protein